MNSVNLIFMSKNKRKTPKKTKIAQKDAYMNFSKAQGLTDRSSFKKGSFRYILIPFHVLVQKDLKQKHFSK